jgi:hypothetical protein
LVPYLRTTGHPRLAVMIEMAEAIERRIPGFLER